MGHDHFLTIVGLSKFCQIFSVLFRNCGDIVQVGVLGQPQINFGSFDAIKFTDGDNGGRYAAHRSYASENRFIPKYPRFENKFLGPGGCPKQIGS